MDNHSALERSYNMSRIKSINTKPEELVRKYLFREGFRYRKNVRNLPGCPDIVLAKYHTVIFINGCFWHAHKNCKSFVYPKSNQTYWRDKLKRNQERDQKNNLLLRRQGWKVLIVWECELKPNMREITLSKLCSDIKNPISTLSPFLYAVPSISLISSIVF